MFEQAVLSYGLPTKRLWTTCVGLTGEALLLTCAVLVPLVSPQVLPRAQALIALVGPPPPPPPPPKGNSERPQAPRAPVQPLQVREGQLFAPTRVPPKPAMIEDPPPEVSGHGVAGGIDGGLVGGVHDGILGSILSEAARAAPAMRAVEPIAAPPRAAPKEPLRLREGGLVHLARPIYQVEPKYPDLARQARVSGVVELVGILGTDGRIRELKVVRGHPLLVRAALDAVRQWIYAPTTLNGDPVEVIAPIIVTFILN